MINKAPRQQPIEVQAEYYGALSRFWKSVVRKYPSSYNRSQATIFTKDYERVHQQIALEEQYQEMSTYYE